MSDGMNEAGWSNSAPVEHAPDDVHPEVEAPEAPESGFSNDAVTRAEPDVEPEANDKADDKADDGADKGPSEPAKAAQGADNDEGRAEGRDDKPEPPVAAKHTARRKG